MSNEEKILQLLEAQQEEFCKINSRLDGVESRPVLTAWIPVWRESNPDLTSWKRAQKSPVQA